MKLKVTSLKKQHSISSNFFLKSLLLVKYHLPHLLFKSIFFSLSKESLIKASFFLLPNIFTAIFQLITATSWQILSDICYKTDWWRRTGTNRGQNRRVGRVRQHENSPAWFKMCSGFILNAFYHQITTKSDDFCGVLLTLPWIAAAFPSSLPSSSSSSLHSQSPFSVLCKWPLEPGTLLTLTNTTRSSF